MSQQLFSYAKQYLKELLSLFLQMTMSLIIFQYLLQNSLIPQQPHMIPLLDLI